MSQYWTFIPYICLGFFNFLLESFLRPSWLVSFQHLYFECITLFFQVCIILLQYHCFNLIKDGSTSCLFIDMPLVSCNLIRVLNLSGWLFQNWHWNLDSGSQIWGKNISWAVNSTCNKSVIAQFNPMMNQWLASLFLKRASASWLQMPIFLDLSLMAYLYNCNSFHPFPRSLL